MLDVIDARCNDEVKLFCLPATGLCHRPDMSCLRVCPQESSAMECHTAQEFIEF